MNERRRFIRQTRLPEVGEAGQARLSAATVMLATTGFAAEVEALYLEGAGVASRREGGASCAAVGSPRLPSSADPHALGLEDPCAREVAEGAFAALVAIRGILDAS